MPIRTVLRPSSRPFELPFREADDPPPDVGGREIPAEPIPVVVTEEAAACVAALGVQREFEQMIEWVKQNAPRLISIRVDTEKGRCSCAAQRGVIIWAHRTPPTDPG